MAVALRLTRRGQKKRPCYRVVAAEHTFQRDGRFIEIIGTYNPLVDPPAIELKEDRVKHWIEVGAQPTTIVKNLITKKIPGFLEERETHRRERIQARRKKRKAALKAKAKKA